VHAGLLRGFVLLVGVLTVGFFWEHRQARSLERTTGEVVDVEEVFGGRGGDDRRFTVRFPDGDEIHRFTTGRGVVGQLWTFADLGVGDEVPVAFDPDAPSGARLDTVAQTYPFTASAGAFALLYVFVVGGMAVTGRLG
jgi:hypothetical protein